MSDLLDQAIAAHGGWERWEQISELKAHIQVGGAIWHVKGWPDVYADIHASASTRRPHTEFSPFLKAGQRCVWEPNRTVIVVDSGEVVEERVSPRSFFGGHTIPTPWDQQHLIYFTGYAMWTYLTTPFLFKLPGFKTEEVEPWDEDGETWRRLKVTFPANVPSHSTEQTFYFDNSGLLRRQDYSVEIMGGRPAPTTQVITRRSMASSFRQSGASTPLGRTIDRSWAASLSRSTSSLSTQPKPAGNLPAM